MTRPAETPRRIFAILPALLALALAACTQATRVDLGHASEDFVADSLLDLAANSDIVIIGSVVSVEDGRFMWNHDELLKNAPPEEQGDAHLVNGRDPHQFLNVTLKAEEVLYGDPQYRNDTNAVLVYEEGFGVPPMSSLEGDRGVYFLELTEELGDPATYFLTSSQGRFLTNEGVVEVSNVEREWEPPLKSLSPEEFMQRVRDTIESLGGTPTPSPAGIQ